MVAGLHVEDVARRQIDVLAVDEARHGVALQELVERVQLGLVAVVAARRLARAFLFAGARSMMARWSIRRSQQRYFFLSLLATSLKSFWASARWSPKGLW